MPLVSVLARPLESWKVVRWMLTVLFERDLIAQRTSEGRARAMAEGTRFGRRPKLTKHQAREARKRVAAGGTRSRDRVELQRRLLDDLPAQNAAHRRALIDLGALFFGREAFAAGPPARACVAGREIFAPPRTLQHFEATF